MDDTTSLWVVLGCSISLSGNQPSGGTTETIALDVIYVHTRKQKYILGKAVVAFTLEP